MSELSIAGISGSVDGIAPVYDPYYGFKLWSLAQIYMGDIGLGRFVPNVQDRVWDLDSNTMYRVTDVNPVTMEATLVKVLNPISDGVLSNEDQLLGVGPGTKSDTYRIFLDTSVTPHTLVVDQRLMIPGSRTKYAKVFRGNALTSTQYVVSALYDAAGNFLGQDIPCELAKVTGNVTERSVVPCKCTESMPNGEVVTVVFYTDDNIVVFKQQLLVENTNFIAGPNIGTKYVKGVALKTPWLSNTDTTLLQFPINVLVESLNLYGQVQYSDGSVLEMPVDGTKFELFGLEDYVFTVVGEDAPIVLNYNLSDNELAIGNTVGENRNMIKNYRAKTMLADGSYSVKLFVYPIWVDALNGYRLEWFLSNLERTAIWRCTSSVRFNANSASFNPTLYGANQRISVTVNLQDVNGTFNNWNHVQVIDITLLQQGTARSTNWQIGFEPGQNPLFGIGNYASTTFIDVNTWKVRLAMDAPNVTEWIDRLMYRTQPLYNPLKESNAPAPNYFALDFVGKSIEFPIAEWNMEHTISSAMPDSDTLFIRFFKRTADNDIQLSIAGVPIYQAN